MSLLDLPPWHAQGILNVVVEVPRGATAKYRYDPELDAFVFDRRLPRGLSYPHDWGFVPGTLAADGDPLDVMVVHEASSSPGVVIRCRVLTVLKVTQKGRSGSRRERNDRILAVPDEKGIDAGPDLLTRAMRRELERFFEDAVWRQGKDVKIAGWGRAWEANAIIRATRRAFELGAT